MGSAIVRRKLRRLSSRLSHLWPRATLRTYLVAILLVATLPLALLLSYQTYEAVDANRSAVQQRLAESATSLALRIAREQTASHEALHALAHAITQASPEQDQALRLLQKPYVRSEWSSLFLADAQGVVLHDTELDAPRGSLEANALQAIVRRVLVNREPEVSQAYHVASGPESDRYTTVLAVPVSGPQDEHVRFVLGARVDVAYWRNIVTQSTPPRGGSLLLTDHHRFAMAQHPPFAAADHPAASRPSGPPRLVGHSDPQPNGHLKVTRSLADSGWSVTALLPAAPIEAEERQLVMSALLTTGACLTAGVSLALLVAWRVTQPLAVLARSGPLPMPRNVAVLEITALRSAMLAAHASAETARRALQAKADDFEALFQHSPIGLMVALDRECRIVDDNAAMRELLGNRASHGLTPYGVFAGGRPVLPHELPLQRAAEQGTPVMAQALELRLDDEPARQLLASATPLRDAQGRPRGAIGAVVDVTAMHQAEARAFAAAQSQQDMQRLIDLVQEAEHVGFFEYRFLVNEMRWSHGHAVFFGTPVHQVRRLQDWLGLIHAEDRTAVRRRFAAAVAQRQERMTIAYRVANAPADAPRWMSTRVVLRYGPAGRPHQMIGVTMDSTEQVELDLRRQRDREAAQAARARAEAANRAKDEFLTMLSHELRNPLGAIMAAAEVLAPQAETGSAPRAVRIIQRQTQHLQHLMNDLLDVGRVVRGRVHLRCEALNLAALVREAQQVLALTHEGAQHRVQVELHDAWVQADVTRMEQVLSNLVSNALKYTPAGGTVHVAVGTHSTAQGQQAVLRVGNTGPGIAPETLPHVFDLFVQGERRLDRSEGGLGIGLTLVRHLVRQHGGEIEVDSRDGWTEFTVTLPAIAPPDEARAQAHAQAAAGLALQRVPPRRVAVLDDNPDVRLALGTLLGDEGHAVRSAEDGARGLALLLAWRPDVALVDIGLPDLDGLGVARNARAAGYAGRMVAISGYGGAERRQQALRAGFDAYLVKPVGRAPLNAQLAEATPLAPFEA